MGIYIIKKNVLENEYVCTNLKAIWLIPLLAFSIPSL